MANNKNMAKAKENKNDEYYTQLNDIEKELKHYKKDFINKTDKQRASYYNYYSTKKWGATTSYNYCLDTSVLGIDGTVELIEHIVEHI